MPVVVYDACVLYPSPLRVSGKLKLRAMSLKAMGEEKDRINAAVLLHEVARTERRCVTLLPQASGETRLAAAIEECGCLLEAGDPPGAAEVWRLSGLRPSSYAGVRTGISFLTQNSNLQLAFDTLPPASWVASLATALARC